MTRAGVFIGVNNTGGLHVLEDAASGAAKMHAWATPAQGFDPKNTLLLTDDAAKVTPDAIFTFIQGITDGSGVDQLVVYFSGHGLNVGRNEMWLLSDAPANPNAAVSVKGSVELAAYCGIRHVVMISDACRVPAGDQQSQFLRGYDIFPSTGASDQALPVDQFFACCLGRTAAEIRDPSDAGTYKALYTTQLLDALAGNAPAALTPADAEEGAEVFVRARPLKKYLEAALPRELKRLGMHTRVIQVPDAIITSEEEWIATARATTRDPAAGRHGLEVPGALDAGVGSTVARMAHMSVRSQVDRVETAFDEAATSAIPLMQQVAATARAVMAPFGPEHMETQCGMKVRGASIARCFAGADVRLEIGDGRDIVRVVTDRPASVLLELAGGSGTVIPAIPGYIAALTFDERELVDVAYEPSMNTPRGGEFRYFEADIRALRAIASASSLHNRFQLDEDDALMIAARMQSSKGFDPTLAVYAAYAFHDLREVGRIREMSGYLRDDRGSWTGIGATFFDLELLGRRLVERAVAPDERIVPFVPLLTQGWALLDPHRVTLPRALDGIRSTLRDSLWSLYDRDGVEKLREAIYSGDVR